MEGRFSSEQIEITNDRVNKYTVVMVPKHRHETQTQHSVLTGFKINAFNVFVVFHIALLLSVTISEGAALPNSASVPTPTTTAPSTLAPTTPLETTTTSVKICHGNTPCGWAVYIPLTRRVDYFMKNTCVCPSDKSCLRFDDDLSVSAYVYRCGEKTPTTEIVDVPVY
ncbi:hypothetical protein PGB90_009160 [Kerria lacca]